MLIAQLDALRWTGQAVPTLVRIPVPTPDTGQVVVRVEAAVVADADLSAPAGAAGQLGLPAGRTACGLVTAVGHGVTGHAVGDRVLVAQPTGNDRLGYGTHAQLVLAAAAGCVPLPGDLTPADGAVAVGVLAPAWELLANSTAQRSPIRAHIAGPLGQGVAFLAASLPEADLTPARTGGADGHSQRTALGRLLAHVRRHDLRPGDLLNDVLPLTAAVSAYEAARAGVVVGLAPDDDLA